MASIEDSKEMTQALTPIRAECFLLCDQALAENGKLYILGGGWDQLTPRVIPFYHMAAIALKLVTSGRAAAEAVAIRIEIVDEKGQLIGQPVVEGNIKGTPTGEVPKGSLDLLPDAAVFLAFAVGLEIQEAGRYEVRLIANSAPIALTRFTVVSPVAGDEADPTADAEDRVP